MSKILTWLGGNIASVLGIAQVVVKLLKELVTFALNVISIVMPNSTWKKSVEVARDIINKIDDGLEKVKGFFLQKKDI